MQLKVSYLDIIFNAKKELDNGRGLDIMSIHGNGPQTPALSVGALRTLVRSAIEKGYYRESFHAEYEHPERNISADDVLHGLDREDWSLAKPPEWSEDYGQWKYLIKTLDVEGEELHVLIAAMPDYNRFEVITRW